MTELRQRDPRQHDERHLVYVRLQPCCIPGCHLPAEAAHLRMKEEAAGKDSTGMGEKPHDKFTVPLCGHHHRTDRDAQHQSNERKWWERQGICPWTIAASLWIESGGAARAAMEKPAHRLRPIKARNPRGERAKIAGRNFSGVPIQAFSRPTGRSIADHDECCSISGGEPSTAVDASSLVDSDSAAAFHAAKARSLGSSPELSRQNQFPRSQQLSCFSILPRDDDASAKLTSDGGKRLPKRYSATKQHRATGKVDKWRGYAP